MAISGGQAKKEESKNEISLEELTKEELKGSKGEFNFPKHERTPIQIPISKQVKD